MATQFETYSQYYDLLYEDKEYEQEVAYLERLIAEFGSDIHDVLELGCGTGRHAERLARSGYAVTGVELSETMFQQSVSRANQLRRSVCEGSFDPHQGDARTFRVDKQFDAVMSLFHVVSYQITNADVTQMFTTAASHLKADGLFVFDVWYGPAVLNMKPTVRVKRMENNQIQVLRIAEPALDTHTNRVDVHYTILVTDKDSGAVTQLSETHPMRYYFAPELDLLSRHHGFTTLHSEEWLTSAAPSDDTWGVTFVLKKN